MNRRGPVSKVRPGWFVPAPGRADPVAWKPATEWNGRRHTKAPLRRASLVQTPLSIDVGKGRFRAILHG